MGWVFHFFNFFIRCYGNQENHIFLVTMATDNIFEKVKHSPRSINYIKHSVKSTSDLEVNWRSYIPQRYPPTQKHNSEKNTKM